MSVIRPAKPSDAPACAAILNAWIDDRDWMPRVHSATDVATFYREFVFAKRQVSIIGDPPEGFLALDVQNAIVTALYVAKPGHGIGKALLDNAKKGRPALELWTFVANQGARRFYAREGFAEVLQDHIADALPKREIYLIGDPPEGYLSLNPKTNHVGALYTARPGHGLGKALMDRAKSERDYLQLWTHAPNTAAQRFYAREGFSVVERKDEGDDGLPELRMEWRR